MARAERDVVQGMKVEIWSDVVCPWCYVGKRRFETALSRFQHADQVEVIWRSFELDPSAPQETEGELAQRLADKYGLTLERAREMNQQMTEMAAAEGLDFHFERARHGNTFDAHRVLHLAAARGLQGDVKERFLRGYFTEGESVGDSEALIRLAAEAGLDEADVRAVVDTNAFAEDVRAEEQAAADLGATGVPFFVIDRRYGVSGAQPADQLLEVLERAWAERPALIQVGASGASDAPGSNAPGCGDDSCAI
jgi:predicted DsbA family dithiol-disulfide isomerase